MLLRRLAVTNSPALRVLTAAMGHYSNVPIQTEWMPRLLQQLLATEHLAFNNSILGPSGSFLADAPGISPPPPQLWDQRRDKEESAFLLRKHIQIREPHAENKRGIADGCHDNVSSSSTLITGEVCLTAVSYRCGHRDQETQQLSQTHRVALCLTALLPQAHDRDLLDKESHFRAGLGEILDSEGAGLSLASQAPVSRLLCCSRISALCPPALLCTIPQEPAESTQQALPTE